MNSSEPQSEVLRRKRWNRFTPDRLLWLLFIAQAFLLLANRLPWLSIGRQKGVAVLVCVAITGAVLLALPIWLVTARLLRKRFQFGLGSLLLLVTSVAMACGWFAQELRKARRQHEIAATAHIHGCSVFYDYNISESGDLLIFRGRHPHITWLHDVLGVDFFQDIVAATLVQDSTLQLLENQTSIRQLYLSMSLVTDDDLRRLARFKRLEILDLSDAVHITDAGLQHVEDLTNLRELQLRRTAVGDEGMVHLRDLRNLEVLDLGMTKVTDKGLVQLAGLKKLQQLHFWGNKIEDPGLAHLRGMSGLETLDLGGAPVTDAGLEYLAELTHLQTVGLRGSRVTDLGLQHCAKWRQLEQLDLFNTQVSDHGLEHLAGLTSLRSVHLGETQVSNEGIAMLQQALPGCKIER